MQDNFKYPRIKKIHQILEKITRFDQSSKSFVSCYHMNCCLQKMLHRSINLHILYTIYFKTSSKIQKIMKIQQVHQKLHTKQFYYFQILVLFVQVSRGGLRGGPIECSLS